MGCPLSERATTWSPGLSFFNIRSPSLWRMAAFGVFAPALSSFTSISSTGAYLFILLMYSATPGARNDFFTWPTDMKIIFTTPQ